MKSQDFHVSLKCHECSFHTIKRKKNKKQNNVTLGLNKQGKKQKPVRGLFSSVPPLDFFYYKIHPDSARITNTNLVSIQAFHSQFDTKKE